MKNSLAVLLSFLVITFLTYSLLHKDGIEDGIEIKIIGLNTNYKEWSDLAKFRISNLSTNSIDVPLIEVENAWFYTSPTYYYRKIGSYDEWVMNDVSFAGVVYIHNIPSNDELFFYSKIDVLGDLVKSNNYEFKLQLGDYWSEVFKF